MGYDRGVKFAHYRQLPSVQEYVLIAQDRPLVERYVRQPDSTWLLTAFDDLSAFLDSLDVFLYLSRSEGLGSAILLAMAHGLPVVASRAGGIPEIVRPNQTGLLVGEDLAAELPAAVRPLLDSAELRASLGEAGRAFVLEHATVDVMVTKTLEVYNEVLASGGSNRGASETGSAVSPGRAAGAKGGRG